MAKNTLTLLLVLFMPHYGHAASVTIRDQGVQQLDTVPTYESTRHFFFWGLSGPLYLNVNIICKGKRPLQLRTFTTLKDGILNFVTLGIYAPRSVAVWCPEGEQGSKR